MNAFFQCVVSVGLFIIIGAAGSVDIDAISLTQAMLVIIAGITVMFIGIIGCNATQKGNKRVIKQKSHRHSNVRHRNIS